MSKLYIPPPYWYTMTRKHFRAIANILKMHKANANLIMDFANECDKHNDYFDLHRFLTASGYYD